MTTELSERPSEAEAQSIMRTKRQELVLGGQR